MIASQLAPRLEEDVRVRFDEAEREAARACADDRVEVRVVRTIGDPTIPRIVVPGSLYDAPAPGSDGLYHLRGSARRCRRRFFPRFAVKRMW